MRITSSDGTSVEVNFYAKGGVKSQVTVQHYKLKHEAEVPRSKRYWAAALDRLKGVHPKQAGGVTVSKSF